MAQISKEKEGHFPFVSLANSINVCGLKIIDQPSNHIYEKNCENHKKSKKSKPILHKRQLTIFWKTILIGILSNPFLPKHARDRNINQSFLFLLFSRQKLLNTCKVIQTHKFRLVWHRDFHLLKVFKAIQHFTSFLSQRQRVERDKCQHMSHQFYMLSENPLPPKYFMRLEFSNLS